MKYANVLDKAHTANLLNSIRAKWHKMSTITCK